ncbi:TPA: hypothetical protein I6W77_003152 [Vibrio cholerae]|nr:hypothetical protein [Vibrio cholerae]HAS4509444.1 hypothetical protein [Vibrio cholerae]
MIYLYFYLIAIFDHSPASSQAVALLILMVMIGAFFYAEIGIFLLTIAAIPNDDMLFLLKIINIADVLAPIALILSMIQGYLFPRKRYTCWRFVYEACAIKAEKKSH